MIFRSYDKELGGTSRLLVGFLAVSCAFGQSQQRTLAEAHGYVLDESGRPLSGILVTYTRVFSSQQASGPNTGTFRTMKDGAFFFNGLIPGSYKFCSQAPQTDLLNPCQWTNKPPLVNLAAGQLHPGIRLTMKKGAPIHVRLADPGQALATKGQPKAGNHVLVVLWEPNGQLHEVPEVAADQGGRNHLLVVPYGLPLRLTMHSANLQVNDQSQKDKSKGDPVPVQVTRGQPYHFLQFSVKGR